MEYIEVNRIDVTDKEKAVVLVIDGKQFYVKEGGRVEFKTLIVEPKGGSTIAKI